MKRFIVVGLGNFGAFLAQRLYQLGHDVVAIDTREEVVDSVGAKITRALVGDATRVPVLEEAGAREANAAIISTGDNLSASILSLLALRDLGVKDIYVKVISPEHGRIVETLGATESIFPERESAVALASRVTSGKLLQYIQLGDKFSLQEMPVPDAWYGKSLRELGVQQRYRVTVVAVHDMLRDEMVPVPDPDRRLTQSDTLVVAGAPEALEGLANMK